MCKREKVYTKQQKKNRQKIRERMMEIEKLNEFSADGKVRFCKKLDYFHPEKIKFNAIYSSDVLNSNWLIQFMVFIWTDKMQSIS